MSERGAAGHCDSSDEHAGALLFDCLRFLKISSKNAFVHYVRRKHTGGTGRKMERFHILGSATKREPSGCGQGQVFQGLSVFPLVVTVQPPPPILGTQGLSWSRLAVGLCAVRALLFKKRSITKLMCS